MLHAGAGGTIALGRITECTIHAVQLSRCLIMPVNNLILTLSIDEPAFLYYTTLPILEIVHRWFLVIPMGLRALGSEAAWKDGSNNGQW